ncbi:hypothetical protein T4B_3912, partial [Trichinella pseudospiralis]
LIEPALAPLLSPCSHRFNVFPYCIRKRMQRTGSMSEENATYKGSVILKATNSIKVKANYQEKPSTLQVSGVPIWIFKKADNGCPYVHE